MNIWIWIFMIVNQNFFKLEPIFVKFKFQYNNITLNTIFGLLFYEDINGQIIAQDIIATNLEGFRQDPLADETTKLITLIELGCCFEWSEFATNKSITNRYKCLKVAYKRYPLNPIRADV